MVKSSIRKGGNQTSEDDVLPEGKGAVRFQMALVLGATALTGVLVSKVLMALQVHAMLLRYPLAVVLSYLAFAGFVKLWLVYLRRITRKGTTSSGGSIGNVIDLPGPGSGSGVSGVFRGAGGNFGGGGASASFNAGMGDPVSPVLNSSSRPLLGKVGGKIGSGLFDVDDDGVILIAVAVVIIVVFGAGAYLVYQAPVILSEALGQVILAGGLIKSSNTMAHPDWFGKVIHATWIPFAATLGVITGLAYVLHAKCPHAHTLFQAIHDCVR